LSRKEEETPKNKTKKRKKSPSPFFSFKFPVKIKENKKFSDFIQPNFFKINQERPI